MSAVLLLILALVFAKRIKRWATSLLGLLCVLVLVSIAVAAVVR